MRLDSLDDLLLTHPDMYLTTGETAIVLEVGTTTVKRWEADGRLSCLKNPRGVRYFRAGDVFSLREILRNRHRGDPPPPPPAPVEVERTGRA
ncbi:MerR family transcriptional regulator [Nocardiopsis lambiniae]|uniref:DNA-binding protein n=1 Tax=Nocardiopsis lambiniae TaxID=3075539 RepID=A0ABU2M9I7_9ACTN|nr:DNA-binding protein [Nocardiopsis sp. DSM 44743]MDT0329329.1 DNA-binding protein [Nocardiopsis sp. DSM 44743]